MDVWRAHGSLIEEERRPGGRIERALTIFLAGAECPFTCSFCDLWRFTIDGPTPPGALPKQIEDTLATLDGSRADRIKLYNASNFFDRRAAPHDDLPRIAQLCAGFGGVTVESHVNTIGSATLDFAARIDGHLEVALGLETLHPAALRKLNKRVDVERFDKAVGFLRDNGIDVRAFVLLGAPYVPTRESLEWTLRSVEHAAKAGASMVAIIPVRGGNGEMERLRDSGEFVAPSFRQLERALDEAVGRTAAVVTVDLWDVERLGACDGCRERRVARLREMNLSQQRAPAVVCSSCD